MPENMTGSAVKRKRLSDITNTVSSSRPAGSSSQFQENSRGFSCDVTKDYISQIIEENASLLKALGERNKIIELSSIELLKLRVALEKGSQQNRHLTLANSQMLAELNLSKEKVKTLQHELGCTMAVLKLKNSELDKKDRKGICEKITSKVATGALSVPSVSNNMAGELDKGLELDKEKQNKELFDDIRTEVALPKCSETASDASVPGSTSTSNPNKKQTLRNRRSTILAHQVQEKEKNELPEKIRGEEEVSREFEIAADIQKFYSVNDNDACKPDRNSELQGNEKLNKDLCEQIISELPQFKEQPKSMEVATAASEDHSVDTNMISKPNRQRSLRNQASFPANLTHQIEVKEEEVRIRRKSSRKRSSNLEQDPCESRDYLFGIVDADIPGCSVEVEPSATSLHATSKHEADEAKKEQSASSQCQTQEERRTSVGRPMRKAAEKVSSYKEMPLKTKMRRQE